MRAALGALVLAAGGAIAQVGSVDRPAGADATQQPASRFGEIDFSRFAEAPSEPAETPIGSPREPEPSSGGGPVPQPAAEAQASEAQATEARPLGAPAAPAFVPPETESQPLSSAEGGLDAGPLRTVLGLAAVCGVIIMLALIVRKAARTNGGLLAALGPGGRAPSGVLSVLGRYPVGRGQTLVLLRCDRRVLLVCQTHAMRGIGGGGMSVLAEFSDAEEIASLVAKTRDESGDSQSSGFRAVLGKLSPKVEQEIAEHIRLPDAAIETVGRCQPSDWATAAEASPSRAAENDRRDRAPQRVHNGFAAKLYEQTARAPSGQAAVVEDIDAGERLRRRVAAMRQGGAAA